MILAFALRSSAILNAMVDLRSGVQLVEKSLKPQEHVLALFTSLPSCLITGPVGLMWVSVLLKLQGKKHRYKYVSLYCWNKT